jgi:predicted DCC family thiol-disulfide oxidoreductase YuxK
VIARAWDRFWFAETPLTRLGAFRMLIMTLVMMNFIAYSDIAFSDAAKVTSGVGVRPWTPLYLFEVLGVQPIGSDAASWVFVAGMVLAAMACVGLLSRVTCLGAAVLHIYWVGLVYSFGKPHHDQVVLAFAVLALPLAPVGARLSLDALFMRYWRTRKGGDPNDMPQTSPFALLPLRLTMLTAAFGYGFSGFTKLVVSGFGWMNGYTLMGHLMEHDNEWARFYIERVTLSQFLAMGTLAIQVLFPLVFFFPRLLWVFLPGAVVFHLSTWQTMDTGPYMTLWFALIAFLALERVPAWMAVKPFLRVPIAAIPTAAVLYVFSLYFPLWTVVFLVPPIAALVIFLSSGLKVTVVFDGSCGMCKRSLAIVKALDWTNALDTMNLRDWDSVSSCFPQLDEEACTRDMHSVDVTGTARAGFHAYQTIAWRLPLAAPLAWLLYIPPIPRIGHALYRRVADGRITGGCGDQVCPIHHKGTQP